MGGGNEEGFETTQRDGARFDHTQKTEGGGWEIYKTYRRWRRGIKQWDGIDDEADSATVTTHLGRRRGGGGRGGVHHGLDPAKELDDLVDSMG